MNPKICRKCPCRCHLLKDCDGEWSLLPQDKMKDGKWHPYPDLWLRHECDDRLWRYVGGTGLIKMRREMAYSAVSDNVIKHIPSSEKCSFFAEQALEEWNDGC